VARQTCHPEQVRALSSIIANNYGLMMFEQVERAKIDLSSRTEAVIRLQGQDLDIEEPLQRGEFEQIIGGEARKIAACLDEALARAQLRHDQIDAVVRTGGSSQIPIFQRMLRARFGAEKIRPLDEFTSVTAGLAIAGRQIAEGSLQLPSYSAEILRGGRSLPAVGEHRSPVLGLRELLRRRARLPRR